MVASQEGEAERLRQEMAGLHEQHEAELELASGTLTALRRDCEEKVAAAKEEAAKEAAAEAAGGGRGDAGRAALEKRLVEMEGRVRLQLRQQGREGADEVRAGIAPPQHRPRPTSAPPEKRPPRFALRRRGSGSSSGSRSRSWSGGRGSRSTSRCWDRGYLLRPESVTRFASRLVAGRRSWSGICSRDRVCLVSIHAV
jgi:hypothetical protein